MLIRVLNKGRGPRAIRAPRTDILKRVPRRSLFTSNTTQYPSPLTAAPWRTPRAATTAPLRRYSQTAETATKCTKLDLSDQDCPISTVTVYTDRAEVIRSVNATVEPGKTEITLSGVSKLIDPNSIRVISAQGEATILEVSSHVNFLKGRQPSNLQEKLRDIDSLSKELSGIKKKIARLVKEREWLGEWSKSLTKGNEANLYGLTQQQFSSVEEFLGFYNKRLAVNDERLEEATLRQEELERLIKRQEQSCSDISASSPVNEIIVVVHSNVKSRVSLQVGYLISPGGAKWKASYESRVSSGDQKLDLTYYGIISNSSGEDWKNVNLVLSTAQPSVAGQPPHLYSTFVRFFPSFQESSKFTRKRMVQSSVAMSASLTEEEDSPNEGMAPPEVAVSSSDSLTTTTFHIPRETTIEADTKLHKVKIRTISIPTEFTHILIPKLSPYAYLKANINNWNNDFPLLPGPMDIFVDNNFVSKSDIPMITPNQSLGIFLGVDNGIKVDYVPLKTQKEVQGLITKTNLWNYKSQVTITNNKKKEIKIEVFDNLPKSSDSRAVVKLVEPSLTSPPQDTKPTTSSQDTSLPWAGATMTLANNIQWKEIVPPGGKKCLNLAYTIEYPFNSEIYLGQ
eukprot:TRINITY_DN15676_c0_g1_i1.p1 TRINITY_DN15676_c0_g1~~TRINITY_DN15676_c0_g1_i1.p1  ORF type:complete len:624 (+),score=162.82 TRINITY_DN15676_c0_g1_i1:28-1899(+)